MAWPDSATRCYHFTTWTLYPMKPCPTHAKMSSPELRTTTENQYSKAEKQPKTTPPPQNTSARNHPKTIFPKAAPSQKAPVFTGWPFELGNRIDSLSLHKVDLRQAFGRIVQVSPIKASSRSQLSMIRRVTRWNFGVVEGEDSLRAHSRWAQQCLFRSSSSRNGKTSEFSNGPWHS